MARLSLSQGWTLTAKSCGRGHEFEYSRARGWHSAECVPGRAAAGAVLLAGEGGRRCLDHV